jgi:hypothetical protein
MKNPFGILSEPPVTFDIRRLDTANLLNQSWFI